MAKGSVTEKDLSSGLNRVGGLGSLNAKKAVRDNPFRSTAASAPAPEPHSNLATKVAERELPEQPEEVVSKPVARAKEAPQRHEPEQYEESPARVPEKPARAVRKKRKADVYTERVTLQMSTYMRDKVDSLARDLQRQKSSKDERITANTVMRVAIELLLSEFKLRKSDIANSEDEVLELVKARILGK